MIAFADVTSFCYCLSCTHLLCDYLSPSFLFSVCSSLFFAQVPVDLELASCILYIFIHFVFKSPRSPNCLLVSFILIHVVFKSPWISNLLLVPFIYLYILFSGPRGARIVPSHPTQTVARTRSTMDTLAPYFFMSIFFIHFVS
jgi:hypothetical protein